MQEMPRIIKPAVALVASCFAMMGPQPLCAADLPVDLELILAVDVSGSMDSDEQKLQRDGYVAAIEHPEILAAIARGVYGRIALSYIEWGGPDAQQTIVGWRLIEDSASAASFVRELKRVPLQHLRGTSISGVLIHAAPQFDVNGFAGLRQVIDVSGDGPNNLGTAVEVARDQVLARGIVINGLPIMYKRADRSASISNLDVYYEDCVIGGPGAFQIPVKSAADFAIAIRRKLTLEIASERPGALPAFASEPQQRIDCMIGEKLRQQWMRE